MNSDCIPSRSRGVPRTDSSMHDFGARASTSNGIRPVSRRIESMFNPCPATTFVTAAICCALNLRPSTVMM